MDAANLSNLFLSLALLAGVAVAFGRLMQSFGHSRILGELLGGILLGPSCFGLLAPDLFPRIFPSAGPAHIGREAIINVGLLFFMFAAGLEVNISGVKGRAWNVALVTLCGSIIPFVLGWSVVHAIPSLFVETAAHAGGNQAADAAVFVGVALAVSALPVIVKTLIDMSLLKTGFGALVVSSAAITDLIVLALFGLLLQRISAEHSSGGAVGTVLLVLLFIAALIIGRALADRMHNWLRSGFGGPSGFLGLAAVVVFAAAAATESRGVPGIFGAFLAGVALAPRDSAKVETHEVLFEFVTVFFAAPIYFASIGLKVDLAASFNPALALLVFAVACCGKIFGAGLGARLAGASLRESLAVGFAMNSRGAMEIVLASAAHQSRIISAELFVALVISALLTSLLTAPAMRALRVTTLKTGLFAAQRE